MTNGANHVEAESEQPGHFERLDDPPIHDTMVDFVEDWASQHDSVDVQTSEHGYPIIDLTHQNPEQAMAFLTALDKAIHPYYHGMHNNEFRRKAGMPEVRDWAFLDPSLSHQEPAERKSVYATRVLKYALVYATMEHKKEDASLASGQTFSVRPSPGEDGTPSFIEVSPHLDAALRNGEKRFTDGLLYILPTQGFEPSPTSNHMVVSKDRVVPLGVVKVGAELGEPIILPPENRWIRQD